MIPSPSTAVIREALVRLAVTRLYSAASALGQARFAPDQKTKKDAGEQIAEARKLMGEALEAIDQSEQAIESAPESKILVDSKGKPFTIGQRVTVRDITYVINSFDRNRELICLSDIGDTMGFSANAKDLKGKWIDSLPIAPEYQKPRAFWQATGRAVKQNDEVEYGKRDYTVYAIEASDRTIRLMDDDGDTCFIPSVSLGIVWKVPVRWAACRAQSDE